MRQLAKYLNLIILVLLPISWFAPLFSARVLPFFGGSQISIASGVIALLHSSIFLALIVFIFAMVSPFLKTFFTASADFGRPLVSPRLVLLMARLSMLDIFLVALYIVAIKGVGIGSIDVEWGLYLFSFCVFLSIAIAFWHMDH